MPVKPPLSDAQLSGAPFHLGRAALEWVKIAFGAMSQEQKLAQILLPMTRDLSDGAVDVLVDRGLGGIHRFPSYSEAELRRSAERSMARSVVPPLLSADIEMSEKASVKCGTSHPNQMAVAATGDPAAAYRMGAIAAREARYLGFSVSWTPVADLALNFRSNAVNTRTFSASVDQTIACMSAYIEGMHDNGLASCVKHFPGDGLDERDQHYVTTGNSMLMDEWWNSFGRIYKAAIEKDVRLIMAGHICLPDHDRQRRDGTADALAHPASLNAGLLQGLLRTELGYNGVIVSDATGMVGFTSQGKRADLVPLCIESGCDILLFPRDIEEDLGHLRAGLASGALSQKRLNEAVARILALKASLGLHLNSTLLSDAERKQMLGTEEHRLWAQQTCRRAVTLVRDCQNLLPLSPDRHRRILLAEIRDRRSPSSTLPDLQVAQMLEARGFKITRVVPGEPINVTDQDIGLYLSAEEGLSGKEYLGPNWERLHGPFPLTMQRMWQELPTLYVSLGSPFLLFHMPDCPTYINAYSPVLPMQEALVEALCGDIPFRGRSPVDPTGGLSTIAG
ncbi:glycoside hydrolase family 3 protein [Nitratireductor sp. ZSWI3]|uniref:glycoside hydrolase family 3 protein n=1 Tax=Nitratireductor sp. ZSWI3 TaxID=2966359 RepID=UPI00214FBCDD|nr:glycoside hydrolase family 3 N-terminal domain-containing protein [Nitratireductor sp. ZSWI3]MCR4265191.1 beta-glucosidase [Nitratireductor sp. ZSWI3]